MKKRYTFLIITVIGFAFLFIVPFTLYYLSKLFYFIGGLVDLYQSFLLNYFEEFSVPFVTAASLFFCISIIGAAIFALISEIIDEKE